MPRSPFWLRSKRFRYILRLLAGSKLSGLLLFAIVPFLLPPKTGAQIKNAESCVVIDGDTLAREPNLVKCAEARLEDEKKKESRDDRAYGLVVLQTDLEQIEVENWDGKPFNSGWLDCQSKVRWYSFHRVPQHIFIKTAFSCPLKVDILLSEHQQIFYYSLWGVASQVYLNMTCIPRGEFTLDEKLNVGTAAESSLRISNIESFLISPTEITNAQFCEFLNDSAAPQEVVAKWIDWENEFSEIKKENGRFVVRAGYSSYPVVLVSAYGARAFCDWLSRKEKRRYRLPTPEEWAWAAQGAHLRRNDRTMPLSGNFSGSGDGIDNWSQLAPVDELPADTLGLKGMFGNVWEFSEAALDDNFPVNHQGADELLTICGGSWLFTAAQIRATQTAQVKPDFRSFAVGFRVAMSCRP